MADLRVRPSAPDDGGRIIDITPASAGWRYVGFELRRLAEGQTATLAFPEREACVLVLAGLCDIAVGAERFEAVGGRSSVFDDAAPGGGPLQSQVWVERTVKDIGSEDFYKRMRSAQVRRSRPSR